MFELKHIVECIGTFIFLSVIIKNVKAGISWAPIPIVVALLAVIFWGGSISGGHFNPAVTTMFYLDNSMELQDAIMYVASQLVGAYGALMFYKMTAKKAE